MRKNKNLTSLYDKNYYKKHRKRILKRCKKYYIENKEKCKKRELIYRKSHKEEIAERKRIYKNKRSKNDINFKLSGNLRTRIYIALKRNLKSQITFNLLGCSIKQLKSHLESKFTPGMSWKNYGKWHIDHIRPCISFNLSIPSEQRKCFHYTNLQLLWSEDNERKGGTYVRN